MRDHDNFDHYYFFPTSTNAIEFWRSWVDLDNWIDAYQQGPTDRTSTGIIDYPCRQKVFSTFRGVSHVFHLVIKIELNNVLQLAKLWLSLCSLLYNLKLIDALIDMMSKEKGPFKCEVCSTEFNSQEELAYHEKYSTYRRPGCCWQ